MNRKSRAGQVRDVGEVAGEEVVDADDRMPARDQRFGQVRSDEAGGAGDDDSHACSSEGLGDPVQPTQHGEPHDLEIERQRPVLDVVEVELDALLERRVAAPAVDLRPAR